jgi:hypothetical protein
MPTKNEEIEILTATIKKLGNDSYIGPWLQSVLATVESDIRNDFMPQQTIEQTRARCLEIERHSMSVIDKEKAAAYAEIEAKRAEFQVKRDNAINEIFNASRRIEKIAENLGSDDA